MAYDSYSDVKGLISLPYAPANLSRLELDDLATYQQKQQYVKLVVDEQLKHNPPHIASPFHVSNNSKRKFYQKITDLYSTAFDYDKDAKTTRKFFQTVQNKILDCEVLFNGIFCSICYSFYFPFCYNYILPYTEMIVERADA